jgi:isoleucyl-tRNA synthetase
LTEIKKLEDYIKTELNIKNIEYDQNEDAYIKLFARPNSPVLGKRLGKDFGKFRGLIEKLPAAKLVECEEKGEISIEGQRFTLEDFLIFREAKEGTNSLSNRFISIDLDCNLNQDLISEGLAREIVNRIQRTRKDMNFNVSDRIEISFDGASELVEAITKHQDHIAKETLATKIVHTAHSQSNFISLPVDELDFKLLIKKV